MKIIGFYDGVPKASFGSVFYFFDRLKAGEDWFAETGYGYKIIKGKLHQGGCFKVEAIGKAA
ncbi:MAG: hypothetical protein LBQ88_00250 [Treponema sp.]|nr:hypothetical protein [Treponema sp.]